jgi:WASH complex subunit 7
MSALAPHDF